MKNVKRLIRSKMLSREYVQQPKWEMGGGRTWDKASAKWQGCISLAIGNLFNSSPKLRSLLNNLCFSTAWFHSSQMKFSWDTDLSHESNAYFPKWLNVNTDASYEWHALGAWSESIREQQPEASQKWKFENPATKNTKSFLLCGKQRLERAVWKKHTFGRFESLSPWREDLVLVDFTMYPFLVVVMYESQGW